MVIYRTRRKKTLKYFPTEKEVFQYALGTIKADKHANYNCIGTFKDKKEFERIINELKNRNVEYYTDEIPYATFDDFRTRILVIGCGIKKVDDLRNDA